MKKLYNYTNTKNAKCVVDNGLVGIPIKEYPEINEKRKELKLNPIGEEKVWSCRSEPDGGSYLISVDFSEKKIKFTARGLQKRRLTYFTFDNIYYNVAKYTIGPPFVFDSSFYYTNNDSILTPKGEQYLVKVVPRMVDFEIPISYISSMEFIDKWWKKDIYVKLKLVKPLHMVEADNFALTFNREDEKDAVSIIDQINVIRRLIENDDRYDYITQLDETYDKQTIE